MGRRPPHHQQLLRIRRPGGTGDLIRKLKLQQRPHLSRRDVDDGELPLRIREGDPAAVGGPAEDGSRAVAQERGARATLWRHEPPRRPSRPRGEVGDSITGGRPQRVQSAPLQPLQVAAVGRGSPDRRLRFRVLAGGAGEDDLRPVG